MLRTEDRRCEVHQIGNGRVEAFQIFLWHEVINFASLHLEIPFVFGSVVNLLT